MQFLDDSPEDAILFGPALTSPVLPRLNPNPQSANLNPLNDQPALSGSVAHQQPPIQAASARSASFMAGATPIALPQLQTAVSPALAASASNLNTPTSSTAGAAGPGPGTATVPGTATHHRQRSSATSLSSSLFGTATPRGSVSSTTATSTFPDSSYYFSGYNYNYNYNYPNEPSTPPDCAYGSNMLWSPKGYAQGFSQQVSQAHYCSGSGVIDDSISTAAARAHSRNRRLYSFPQAATEMPRFDPSLTGLESQMEQLNMGSARTNAAPANAHAISTGKRRTVRSTSASSALTSPLTAGRSGAIKSGAGSIGLMDTATDILNLARDQYGCRYLQRRIDEDYATNFHLIFSAVYSHAAELMVEPFGNYLIQKLISSATPDELSLLLINCGPSLYTISINQHGTRACQKMIDCLTTKSQHQMLETYMAPHIVDLIQDLNGNHVVQKCIQKFHDEDLQFLVDLLCSNILAISTHKHGCCVLQKLMNKCTPQQVNELGWQIVTNSIVLIQDQFGNYVIQYMISLELPELNKEIIRIMLPYLVELSTQKFSSNVVEKCLKMHTYRTGHHAAGLGSRNVNPILDELLRPPILDALIKDQYGNYVVQTAIDVSPFEYKLRFALAIKPLLPMIRFATFGKRIQNRITTIIEEAQLQGLAPTTPPASATPATPTVALSSASPSSSSYSSSQQQQQQQQQLMPAIDFSRSFNDHYM